MHFWTPLNARFIKIIRIANETRNSRNTSTKAVMKVKLWNILLYLYCSSFFWDLMIFSTFVYIFSSISSNLWITLLVKSEVEVPSSSRLCSLDSPVFYFSSTNWGKSFSSEIWNLLIYIRSSFQMAPICTRSHCYWNTADSDNWLSNVNEDCLLCLREEESRTRDNKIMIFIHYIIFIIKNNIHLFSSFPWIAWFNSFW